ncbi:pyruvate dehydrogenase complex dihydrolipoamide acetyltransferase [Sphingobium phenoxybenzoativorans]|uniref:Acetyltransferase component of pyruvate dehydrogenase complex n=1 Tax=Sphingobium phenoxybenzoativorans TaxID=1592790 RepID=A0A975K2Y6_9SPHN|nr:pyruvate dehydrogenase complex dihydrolipoamide acetyltransferase [Sphingobium phenoxybenzoativorans]QUT03921.1 pyruvate dehydrogenase complex dihydrolipoamide acetyltransferase [Sphingobium phenoxybenzoativorans]
MTINIQMPALSPTMEEGTLAKWLVKEGDTVKSGDLLAEIETDKATMEFEAVDEGTITKIMVPEGSEGVKVGTVIATLAGEGEDAAEAPTPAAAPLAEKAEPKADATPAKAEPAPVAKADPVPAKAEKSVSDGDRLKASPLARRLAEQSGLDLSTIEGSGPNGRIVKADLDGAKPSAATAAPSPSSQAAAPSAAAPAPAPEGVPSETIKLSSMRKVIARRLTESKQTVPHFYLTLDCNLDKLLKLRGDLNKGLESRGVKLSVNDLLIKALGIALTQVPDANVQFSGDNLIKFHRADISMAVAIPGGLITPVITDVGGKSLSKIATEAKDLAARARDGKLQPQEYQGGTASISNLGMFGIKQFDAVINPPQGMILAVGAGDKRPHVVDGALAVATVMTATGSFDHRAIDGAVGAQLMQAFQALVENPLSMLA